MALGFPPSFSACCVTNVTVVRAPLTGPVGQHHCLREGPCEAEEMLALLLCDMP